MNCKSAQTYLSAYLDGELSGQESLQMRDHLSHCRECQAEELQLRTLKQMLRGLPLYEPTEGFEDRLVSQVMRTSERKRRFTLSFGPSLRFAGGLAAVAIIAGFGLVKLTERRVPTATPQPTARLDGADYEFTRDQMFMAGNDPLSGNRFVVPTSYGHK